MSSRRGLTLLEVLLAAALLSLLAVACIPLIQKSLRVLDSDRGTLHAGELSLIVDQMMQEPAAFGLEADLVQQVQQHGPVHIAWPDDSHRAPITVHALAPQRVPAGIDESDEPPTTGLWLTFACERTCVSRWINTTQERQGE